MAVLPDQPAEPRVAEEVAGRVHRLGDAVGVEGEHVPLVQLDAIFLEQLGELFRRPGNAQADNNPARRADLRRRGGAVAAQVDQRRVAGAGEGHRPLRQIDHAVGHGDEAARIEVLGDDPVHLHQKLARGGVDLAEGQHQPLQLGHVERGGGALAGHVGDEDAELAVADVKEIVVVAADLARGDAQRGHVDPGKIERAARQQRHLDLARDAELFLHPLLLGRRQK